ncbi:MAG: apolipoprotein N-acyltransferase [Micrococcales bacterium]|nr:apolipoprotein N-acyltransferase [Micrococcales bacterium]
MAKLLSHRLGTRTWLTSLSLAAAGGVTCFAAFPPLDLWYLAPAACALLVAALDRMPPLRAFLPAWLFATACYLPLFWWAQAAAGLLPWLALSVASGAMFALVGPAWALARRLVNEAQPRPGRTARAKPSAGRPSGPRPARALTNSAGPALFDRGAKGAPILAAAVFATVVAGVDTLRSFVPFGGFGWGRLAFSQAGSPMGRWAWLAGSPWVSWSVAFAGALVFAAARAVAQRRFRLVAVIGAGLAGAVAAPILFPLTDSAEVGQLRLGVVQGNVAVTDEGLFAHQREVLDNHVAGTKQLAGEPIDLVIWPENATDIDPQTDPEAWAAIDSAAQLVDAPILLGSMEYTETSHRYNLGILWLPGQGPVAKYAKRHPAPFAEYIPGRSFFRHFTTKVDLIGTDMLAGSSVGLFDVPIKSLGRDVRVGDVICFEVAYDSLVAQTVQGGAELIIVQTNNASFGRTSESTQQLAMSRLRAIELGRATIQASTVGVSAAISPSGQVSHQTELFQPAVFTATVPLRTSRTPASGIVGPISWALMVVAGAGVLTGLVHGRSRQLSPPPRPPKPARQAS